MGAARLSAPARRAHLLVAGMAILGVALSYAGLAHAYPPHELWWRTVRFWSFFTNLSNAAVALAGIGYALPSGWLHNWATRPGTRTAISVYILVVGVIFQALLAHHIPFGVTSWWSNLFVHQLVPAGWLLCWFVWGPHGGVSARAPLVWMIPPLAYAAWIVVHGLASDWYPYPFIDAGKLGWPATARNMALFTLFFAGLGFLFRWMDGRLARRG